MIRPLRRVHRAVFLTFVVVLPAGAAGILASRDTGPVAVTLPGAAGADRPALARRVDDRSMLWGPAFPADASILRLADQGLLIELRPTGSLRLADPLVYVVPGGVDATPDAPGRLLGQLTMPTARLVLPPPPPEGWRVVLYSLPRREVVAQSAPWRLQEEGS